VSAGEEGALGAPHEVHPAGPSVVTSPEIVEGAWAKVDRQCSDRHSTVWPLTSLLSLSELNVLEWGAEITRYQSSPNPLFSHCLNTWARPTFTPLGESTTHFLPRRVTVSHAGASAGSWMLQYQLPWLL